jgi:hypothetical protein
MKYRTQLGLSRRFGRFVRIALLPFLVIFGDDVNAFLAVLDRRSRTGDKISKLKVSELHVPGYAESKIPFILKEEDFEVNPLESGCERVSAVLRRKRSFAVQIYSPDDYDSLIPFQDGHLLHRTTRQVFSFQECQQIIAEAEKVASEIEWTRSRHGNFPTTDLPLVELPYTLRFLRIALEERLYPLLRAQFGQYLPDQKRLRVADGFVVKYEAMGGQTELKPHRDGSVLSFNVALNPGKCRNRATRRYADSFPFPFTLHYLTLSWELPATEYEGGGTWFSSLNDVIKINQGQVISHASALLHGGQGITRGRRYILVAFVILEGYDSWSMRFYNSVRNL